MRRLVVVLVLVAAVLFAIQGGEYGTSDLVRQDARKRQMRRVLDSLQREVDSLTRVKRSIETDAAVQERIAREEFGMVKGDRELLFRFTDKRDTARP